MTEPKLNSKEFGKRIKKMREKKGLSKKEFADSLGFGINGINVMEASVLHTPGTETICKVANLLDISAAELFCNSVDGDKFVLLNELTEFINQLEPEDLEFISPILKYLIKYYKDDATGDDEL